MPVRIFPTKRLHHAVHCLSCWTPDGAGVVFRCTCSEKSATMKMSVSGGDPQPFAETMIGGAHMSFSPDRTRIMDVVGHRILWVSPVTGGFWSWPRSRQNAVTACPLRACLEISCRQFVQAFFVRRVMAQHCYTLAHPARCGSLIAHVPDATPGNSVDISLSSSVGSGTLASAAIYCPSPTILPASGLLQLLYDGHRNLLYALKATEVDVLNPTTLQWQAPLILPALPPGSHNTVAFNSRWLETGDRGVSWVSATICRIGPEQHASDDVLLPTTVCCKRPYLQHSGCRSRPSTRA